MAMVRSITHFGENGSGLKMKLVANHLVSGQLCLLAEALTLGHKTGLPMDAMADYLFEGGIFEVMKTKGREMARRDYTPLFKTDLMAKDLRQVASLAESVHAPIPFSALAKQIFSGAQALGHGQDDQNAVLEVFTRLGGDG
jgi:3-hydroxyisobutyrate dehydrogenase-like beta-hydroxyacid dehydrogenase